MKHKILFRGMALIFTVLSLFPAPVLAAEDEIDASEADGMAPQPKNAWNEFESPFMTARFGGGFLVDTASYKQDTASREQMELSPTIKLRDFRLLMKGRFPQAPRLSYTLGYMYDAPNELWRFRQTGLMVNVPEWQGEVFLGRTKEGFSTSKIMVGYHGWTNERAAVSDAMLPILADGVKWTGNAFAQHLVYNVGFFVGSMYQTQSYIKNDREAVARFVWLPYAKDDPSVLHLAAEVRHGPSVDGSFQFRSKPESYPAQSYAVDTGKFPAKDSTGYGVEAYYRPSAWMFGMEYFGNQITSEQTRKPFFHGGEIFAAYVLTGEIRPYNHKGALWGPISPSRSAFSGGLGAFELVARYSYVNLNSGTIRGGIFQRVTPMLNWHLSDNMRFEFVYGYGVLDRFDKRGETQFFQTRLQLSL